MTTCTPNTARTGFCLRQQTRQRHHISASDTLTSLSSAPCAPIAPCTPFLIPEKQKRWPRPVRPSPTSKIATATSGYTSAATRHQVPPGGARTSLLVNGHAPRRKIHSTQKKHTTPPRAAECCDRPYKLVPAAPSAAAIGGAALRQEDGPVLLPHAGASAAPNRALQLNCPLLLPLSSAALRWPTFSSRPGLSSLLSSASCSPASS